MTSALRKSINLVLFAGLMMASQALADTLATNSSSKVTNTQSCPTSFFDVSLMSDARQCQQFDDSLPASLVYFTKRPPEQVITFYQNTYPKWIKKSPVNHRTMLEATDDSVRIVVSPDNLGTQVDVLIIRQR